MIRHQSDIELPWTLVSSDETLSEAAAALAAGVGNIGVDAERASGFRYYDSAYLVQVARRGAGTFLIDPVGIKNFAPLTTVMNEQTWILHAATQDLPCLNELGLHPAKLLDTELAGRLLRLERVNLGALAERYLDIQLDKLHSAQDWSQRPLPEEWLEYAAFDAGLLPALWDAVEAELREQNKLHIAQQEFEHVRTRPPKPPRSEPWRHLKGVHELSGTRELAIARELWLARDEFAREADVAPGRVLRDRSIVKAAQARPRSAQQLISLRDWRGKHAKSEIDRWWSAVVRGKHVESIPAPAKKDPNAVPSRSTWARRRPEAAQRLAAARRALAERAEQMQVPVESLLDPQLLRQLAWDPPAENTHETIAEALLSRGARPWQIKHTAEVIAEAFVDVL